jgi:hypothetical protein
MTILVFLSVAANAVCKSELGATEVGDSMAVGDWFVLDIV